MSVEKLTIAEQQDQRFSMSKTHKKTFEDIFELGDKIHRGSFTIVKECRHKECDQKYEYKCEATFRKDGSNNKHLSTLVTQQYTNFIHSTNSKVFGMVIATVNNMASSYRSLTRTMTKRSKYSPCETGFYSLQEMYQKRERCVEPLPSAYMERYDASLALLEHLASTLFRHLRHGGKPCSLSR